MTTHDIGDLVTVYVDFTDDATPPAATDPTAVTLHVRAPNGTITTVEHDDLDHPTTGRFEHELPITASGDWWYRFEGIGAVQAAVEDVILVRRRRVEAS